MSVSALTGPVYEASLTAAEAELVVLKLMLVLMNHSRPLESIRDTLPVAAFATPGCLTGLPACAARFNEPLSDTDTAASALLP